MTKKLVILMFLFFSSALLMNAEDLTRNPGPGSPIVVLPSPEEKPKGKPRMPAKIPFECWAYNGFLSIVAQYPICVTAQISADVTGEFVASYFSTGPNVIHYIDCSPQNTTLTIEIEVDGKTYTGEFFY